MPRRWIGQEGIPRRFARSVRRGYDAGPRRLEHERIDRAPVVACPPRSPPIHDRHQDPLGPGAGRLPDRARRGLGRNAVGRLAPRLPGATRPADGCLGRRAGLPTARLFPVVVLVRRLRAAGLLRGGRDRRGRWLRGDRHRHRHVGVARPRSAGRHHLRLGPLGDGARSARRRSARPRWGGARLVRAALPPAQRAGACAVLRAHPLRQGRGPRCADAVDLAGLSHRPRHQGPELAAHRRLAGALRARAAVRSDQPGERRLQPAARGPPRR